MPGTEFYPFRRLAVDHMIVGTSRIWWEMHRDFLEVSGSLRTTA